MLRCREVCFGRRLFRLLIDIRLRSGAEPEAETVQLVLRPVLELFPAGRSRLSQCIPCCAAKIAIWTSVASLSPERAPEFVKPAAILLRQANPFAMTAFDVASERL